MAGPLGWFSDWLFYLLGVVGLGGGGGLVGYVRSVDRKADDALSKANKNERRLEGDPGDPNTEGVLQITYQTREQLRDFRAETRREHRQVMERLDEIQGE